MTATEQGIETWPNKFEVLPGYPGIRARFLSGVIRNPALYGEGNVRHPYDRGRYGACTDCMRTIRTGKFAIEMQ